MSYNDIINNPTHYSVGGIQPLDYLKAKMPLEMTNNQAVLWWNVGKYHARCGHKSAMLRDLKKARFFLERLINDLESQEEKNK